MTVVVRDTSIRKDDQFSGDLTKITRADGSEPVVYGTGRKRMRKQPDLPTTRIK